MAVETPGMREARLEQLARLTLAAVVLARPLGWQGLVEDLEDAHDQAAAHLDTHRAEHGQTVPDRDPVA